MLNAWRILLALECLSMRHGVACEIGEVLHSYYLKEHDTNKGRYQLIVRKDRVPLVTCMRTNDRGWKNRLFFAQGELVYGPRVPGDATSHWRATSKCLYCFCSLMLTDNNPFVFCRS